MGRVELGQGLLEAVDVVVDEPLLAEVLLPQEGHEGEVAVILGGGGGKGDESFGGVGWR